MRQAQKTDIVEKTDKEKENEIKTTKPLTAAENKARGGPDRAETDEEKRVRVTKQLQQERENTWSKDLKPSELGL